MGESVPAVAVVVVTYDALPWIERSLESVRGIPTVVVDVGSTDGTLDVVRERFPTVQVLETENRGLGAGWNAGIGTTSSRYVLLLNADAWLVGGALDRLVAFADAAPAAALVAPKLVNPDGSLQRSVRGFPTVWRLATEYFFLRKLAPWSRSLNAFYAGGFDHDEVRSVEWVMGACMLVRRGAIDEVGLLDEDFFLFSEETDWCFRFHRAGREVIFIPAAQCVHVGGAAHGGRLFRENVRGNLLFLWKHGEPGEAERARRMLLAALRLRVLLYRGERAARYREVVDWLSSGDVGSLLGR